jgi:hypothetical protein
MAEKLGFAGTFLPELGDVQSIVARMPEKLNKAADNAPGETYGDSNGSEHDP